MNGLPQPAYVMSEPHLSGYRVIVGYETLSDAQAAQAALCRPQAREAAQPPTCQKCGGEIAGWCCQRCPAAFRENDDGALIFNEDATPPAPEAEKLRVAGETIRAEINAPLSGPTHGAWDRGRIAGLKEALATLQAEQKGGAA